MASAFAFYLIGNDDCNISKETCIECLLQAWDQAKTALFELTRTDAKALPLLKTEDSSPASWFLIHAFDETQASSLLHHKVEEAGIKVSMTVDSIAASNVSIDVIAVGAIRALRRGGDLANIQLHRQYPLLDEWIRNQYQAQLGAYGKAYTVWCDSSVTNGVKAIVLVVAPNMNEKRAGYTSDKDLARTLLTQAYKSMFENFTDIITKGNQRSCVSESNDARIEVAGADSAISHKPTSSNPFPIGSKKRIRLNTELSIFTTVRTIGLGTLPFGVVYPNKSARPSEAKIHEMVLDACFASPSANQAYSPPLLLDLADTYCEGPKDLHYIEKVIGRLLKSKPSLIPRVAIATKSGMLRVSSESTGWRIKFDIDPQYVRRSVLGSLEALGLNSLFLWQLHHTDQIYKKNKGNLQRIITEAFAMKEEGLIDHVGVCNCTSEMLHFIASSNKDRQLFSCQNEYNFWCRDPEKKGVFASCKELGLVFIAHSPFGGLKARRGERSIVKAFPELLQVARQRDCSYAQIYLRYLLARGERFGLKQIIVIPGARDPAHAADSARAANISLSANDMDVLDRGWNRDR